MLRHLPKLPSVFKKGRCDYVGIRNVARYGTYQSECPASILKRAIAVLESQGFYNLSYDSSVLVLDAPHYVVSAERCGVTTKLDWPVQGDRKDIESMLHGLDALTDSVSWHKVSHKAHPM